MIESISDTFFYVSGIPIDLIAMRVKTELYSGMRIHEIRQPLTKIMQEYELYKRGRRTVSDEKILAWYRDWQGMTA